jgi:hypothetical protein
VIAAPSASGVAWQTKAWNDMLRLAPEGSIALGRVRTISQIQKNCLYLDSGVDASELLDDVILIAMASGYDKQQQADMFMYGVSTVLVAGKRLCPRHLQEIWLAMNSLDR